MQHLVQVETLKSETLSHVNFGISTEFDNVKCFTLMCLNLNQMLHSNGPQHEIDVSV